MPVLEPQDRLIIVEGGGKGGRRDDLDFDVEAIPLPGRADPGPGSGSVPWCRWVVRSVGFFPPRGRPGPGQVAGLRPGDQLIRVVVPGEPSANAGRLGRECMRQELDRLCKPENDLAPARSLRLEFRRHPGAAAAGGEEMEGQSRTPGLRRRRLCLPQSNASLSFIVFQEKSWAPDGGRLVAVRLMEDAKAETETKEAGLGERPPALGGASSSAAMGRFPESDKEGSVVPDPGDPDGGSTTTGDVNRCVEKVGYLDGCPLQLLGLPEDSLSSVRRRAGLPQFVPCSGSLQDTTQNNGNGLEVRIDDGSVSAWKNDSVAVSSSAREGEQRVELVLGRYPVADDSDDAGTRGDHLLNGLTQAAVSIAKERIFSTARLEYARLYGLFGQAAFPGTTAHDPMAAETFGSGGSGDGEGSNDEQASVVVVGTNRDTQSTSPGKRTPGRQDVGAKRKRVSLSGTDSSEDEEPRKRPSLNLTRPAPGALSAVLGAFIRDQAFRSWVEDLREWSRMQRPGSHEARSLGMHGHARAENPSEPRRPEVAEASRGPLEFFVAWRPLEHRGEQTWVRYAGAYPELCGEAAGDPGVQQVTVPSVPTDRMEREEVFQSIATVAKRLYPRWDAVHGSGRRNGSYGGNPTVDRSAAIKPSPHCGMEGNAASSTDASDAALSATASLTRPGAFSVAVNRLLRTTPSVQLDSRPPRVSPENLRSMLLRTAREGSSRCCLCRLSLASGCDCSAAFLRESRTFWQKEGANVLDRSRHNHLAAAEYTRRSKLYGYSADIAKHRRQRVDAHRLDHSVALHHRGLLCFPPISAVKAPAGTPPAKKAVCPAEQGDLSIPSASEQESCPSIPRLETWPGFKCPAKAFAPAAPVENGAGLLPPSSRLLHYIHQVASMKADALPELFGTLEESALQAVGVLVEEMLEELVAPLVDGRTRGYKNLTRTSLDRELAFYRRIRSCDYRGAAEIPTARSRASTHSNFASCRVGTRSNVTTVSRSRGDELWAGFPEREVVEVLKRVFGEEDPLRCLSASVGDSDLSSEED